MAVKAALPRAKRESAKEAPAAEAPVDYQEVARVAYELYQKRGCVNGYDQEDWFKALQIVSGKNSRKKAYAS